MLIHRAMRVLAITVACLLAGGRLLADEGWFGPTKPADKASAARKAPPSTAIPSDVATFKGHAYKFFAQQLTWKEAKSKCASLGGHLVIVDSAEENKFVADLVAKADRQDAWIGITDEAQEGAWRTVDGKLLSYTNWFTGQPNNKDDEEHYALMSNRTFGKPLGWTWCDQPNESTQHQPGYVCEWDTAAKTATKSKSPPTQKVAKRKTPEPKPAGSGSAETSAKGYVIVWEFDATKGSKTNAIKTPSGETAEILIAAPTEEPYQKVRWELQGVLSHRVKDVEGGRVIAVRTAGPRFRLRVAVEPTADVIAKPKADARVPADIAAALRDNVALAVRNPRTAELASKLKGKDAAQTVQNIRQWIKENMSYHFSLELKMAEAKPVGGIDSIVAAKRGDCGAHSDVFVALCRLAGVPARMVWGGARMTEPGGPLTPEQRRAAQKQAQAAGLPPDIMERGDFCSHARAEIYLKEWGWIPLEPQDPETPLGRLPPGDFVSFLRFAPSGVGAPREAILAETNAVMMSGCFFARLEPAAGPAGKRSRP